MSLVLVSSNPLIRTSEIALDRLPAIVGRDPDCDICLRDPWVSRLHCEIDKRNGQLVVLDLQSKHGTFVNGRRVSFARLSPGDIFRLGSTRFVVEREGTALRSLPCQEGITASEFCLR